MEPFQKIVRHPFAEDRRVVAVAAHVKILVAECVKRCAEYLRIKETVLREHIQFTVRDDRTREEQLEPCLISKGMEPLALLAAILFQFVCLVCYDQVGVICQQFLFETPCRFVIYDHDLQALVRQLCQLFLLLCDSSLENRQRIREVSELIKFLLPYAEDGKRRYHQHTVDLSVLVHTSGNGDAHYRFAGAHFHQKRRAAILKAIIKYTELIAGECKRLFLMVIRSRLDRHHQFDVLIHCRHLAFP